MKILTLAAALCCNSALAHAQSVTIINTGSKPEPAGWASFGEVFPLGAIPKGDGIAANGAPAQIDVRTAWPDGSARIAEVTMHRPALASKASMPVMLAAAAAPAGNPVSLSALIDHWTMEVYLHDDLHLRVRVRQALLKALSAGKVKYWRRGPCVTEGRVDVPVSGAFHLLFNVARFADGTVWADTQFDNDHGMGATGGPVNYSADIWQNGKHAYRQALTTQYQYEDWQHAVSTQPDQSAIVIAHDIAAIEATGALPDFDTPVPVAHDLIATEASRLGGPTYGVLGSAGIMTFMPTTGGRDDIGPQPLWNVIWLRDQTSRTARDYALAQADAGSGIPWHVRDVTTGSWVSVYKYPELWLDPRATVAEGYTPLTQPQPSDIIRGWVTDTPHQPDLSYVAYLLTGQERYLDGVQAQAAWSIGNVWTPNRQHGAAIVVNGADQVREQAWNARQVNEAAYASPDGSAEAAYFRPVMAANWRYAAGQVGTWTTQQGAPHGYIPGTYSNGTLAPWEQGYFLGSTAQAVQMGNADALTVMKFESNFLVGGYTQQANGFKPAQMIDYNLQVGDPVSGTPYPTWARVGASSDANGPPNWPQSQGDYPMIGEWGMANFINAGVDRAAACSALKWLHQSGAPDLSLIDTQFEVVPLVGC